MLLWLPWAYQAVLGIGLCKAIRWPVYLTKQKGCCARSQLRAGGVCRELFDEQELSGLTSRELFDEAKSCCSVVLAVSCDTVCSEQEGSAGSCLTKQEVAVVQCSLSAETGRYFLLSSSSGRDAVCRESRRDLPEKSS